MTPAGTSNELDVQNGWEENTHTHMVITYRKSMDQPGEVVDPAIIVVSWTMTINSVDHYNLSLILKLNSS